jgi:outer membrane protein TolC
MRWKSVLGGLALGLAFTAGCKQTCFLSKDDLDHYQTLMPCNLERDPAAVASPLLQSQGPPMTLYNLDRQQRFLSLAEAIAMALENGTVGNPTLQVPGTIIDTPPAFTGRGLTSTDSIRVLALDPAITGAGIESSLSKFDAVWTSSLNWTTTDRPIGTALDVFQAGGAALNNILTQAATFSTAILKPLPTGGVAGVTFRTDYQFTNLPARVNPSYQPSLQFQFEQPLLQGFGVEINQLTAQHPGSLLTPGVFNPQPTPEGILITRLRYDEQRADFEKSVQTMLGNVEVAYWNLYGSYWNLYSREQALRFAFVALRLTEAKFQAGRVTAGDVAQSRGQYELFRSQRLTAVDQVLENERQLRRLIGLRVEDGYRLVPSDAPTLAPYQPDWNTAFQEAMTLRPELFIARQDVKAAQLQLMVAKNQLLPDLRFTSTYDTNSIGSRLDGPDTQNAFRNLASDMHHNWALGLRLNVPIGFRNANANVRIARLQLARAYESLEDFEKRTETFLSTQYRKISTSYELIRANRAQREAFAEQLRVKFEEYKAGRATLDIVLEAQRFYADALSNEYAAIVNYNNSLVGFEYAKGTILVHDNVVISEGPLPGCVQKRAVEHERERAAALVLRERANPVCPAPCQPDHFQPPIVDLPSNKTVSLPALLEKAPPVPEGPNLSPTEQLKALGTPQTKAPNASTPPSAEPRISSLSDPKTMDPYATDAKILPPPPSANVRPAAHKKKGASDFGTYRDGEDAPKPTSGLPTAPVPVGTGPGKP